MTTSLQLQALERRFNYNGLALPDPAPGMSIEQVREFYAATYPELSTAAINGPETEDGRLEYSFTRAIGTKG